MRKCFVLMAVGALLCAMAQAQTTTDGQSNNSQQSEALPADAQPVNAPKPPQPSLGEYARQLRLKKQQREAQLQQAKENKEKQTPAPETQSADVKPAQHRPDVTPEPQAAAEPPIERTPDVTPKPQATPQVVTTAEIPERATVTPASVRQTVSPAPQSQEVPSEAQVRQWKAEIQQQKSLVASLQQDITNLKNSIHFAGGNCIANCDQWNDRQKQKKQDLEMLQAQLQEQQGILGRDAGSGEGFDSSSSAEFTATIQSLARRNSTLEVLHPPYIFLLFRAFSYSPKPPPSCEISACL